MADVVKEGFCVFLVVEGDGSETGVEGVEVESFGVVGEIAGESAESLVVVVLVDVGGGGDDEGEWVCVIVEVGAVVESGF